MVADFLKERIGERRRVAQDKRTVAAEDLDAG
jgi:hypothetical protein